MMHIPESPEFYKAQTKYRISQIKRAGVPPLGVGLIGELLYDHLPLAEIPGAFHDLSGAQTEDEAARGRFIGRRGCR